MLHRVREACGNGDFTLSKVVEVDETYIGGKEKNKHKAKKLNAGRGAVGKETVVGIRERDGHRILKPEGSVYLHCDPTASHYLKLLMDAVFHGGGRPFRNEVIWQRTSSRNDAKRWGAVHDTLLIYAGPNFQWNRTYQAHDSGYVERTYRRSDKRGRYRLHEIIRTASMVDRPNLAYEYKGYTPRWGWRRVREKVEALDREGRLIWSKGGLPYVKVYLRDNPGTPIRDVIVDCPPVSGHARERTGYPTQKPLALLDRIIRASSDEGDMVLDPFCGCATTLVAADRLGRQWAGIDLSPLAIQLVNDRIAEDRAPKGRGKAVGGSLFRANALEKPPERTDMGSLPNYRTHRHRLYGEQEGVCAGCDTHFPFRVMDVDHMLPRAKGRLEVRPARATREGQDREPGADQRGTGNPMETEAAQVGGCAFCYTIP